MKEIVMAIEPTNQRTWKRLISSIEVSKNVYEIINSDDFRSGDQNPSRKVAIVEKKDIGQNCRLSDMTSDKIYMKAQELELSYPDIELALQLWEELTYKKMREMGLSFILIMHKPVIVDGRAYRLAVERIGRFHMNRLAAIAERSHGKWDFPLMGFAFLDKP